MNSQNELKNIETKTISEKKVEKIFAPEGDYIYGPANSVIGMNTKDGFIPLDMPEQRAIDTQNDKKGANQADLDLLKNKEALEKYISQKGLRFKKEN
jgi:hypothetical protein